MKSKILTEDSHILVCAKPPGLAVQSGRIGEPDMVSELKNYLGGRNPYLGLVHRLDQPVSGLLVFAKTPQAAAGLSQQAAGRGEEQPCGKNKGGKQNAGGKDFPAMEKEYLALVYTGNEGALREQGEEIKLVDYLLRDAKQNSSKVVGAGVKGAKRAGLLYKVENKKEKQALVRVRLLTGRHHQIRVQLSNAGLPLLGDAKYGTRESREYSAQNGFRNICLCAFHLSFYHPATGKKMDFYLEELPWDN